MSNHDANQDQDKDLGGEALNSHFILIGNLERNLSPSSIREFIYRHTFISPQAYMLPSPSTTFAPFARAVIMLDCKKQHEKVYQFLDNPDHFVVSMRGRYACTFLLKVLLYYSTTISVCTLPFVLSHKLLNMLACV